MPPSPPSGPDRVRLDVANQCLLFGRERVPLTARAFALLRFLLAHRDRLVSKQAILQAVWHDVVVTPGQVKQFVAQLRIQLRDLADAPRFIETVHGRGYRFVGAVDIVGEPPSGVAAPSDNQEPSPAADRTPLLLERDTQLAAMVERLDKARRGQAGLCLVRGGWGAGKTALVSAFVRLAHRSGPVLVLQSLCTDTYGRRERYFPLLDALDALSCAPEAPALTEEVRLHAPLWHARLPGGVGTETADRADDLPERMLREGLHLFEHLGRERTVVLCIDDLHHADVATVELLRRLLARDRPASLLIVATCGPVEASPARRALGALVDGIRAHDPQAEIVLPPLSREGVAALVAHRAPHCRPGLGTHCFELSQGHPLLAGRIAERIAASDDPTELSPQERRDAVRSAVWHRLDALDGLDARILEAGSAEGPRFSAAAVASALGLARAHATARLATLARADRFVRAVGAPGAAGDALEDRFEFSHELVREAVREHASAAPAAEFDAGDRARRRRHLAGLPDRRAAATPVHGSEPPTALAKHRVSAWSARHPRGTFGGDSLISHATAASQGTTALASWGALLQLLRQGEFQRVLEQGGALLERSRTSGDPEAAATARTALGCALFHLGDFTSADRHLREPVPSAVSRFSGHGHASVAYRATCRRSHAALVNWVRGDDEAAHDHLEGAVTDAGEDSLALALAWTTRAKLHQFRAEAAEAAEAAQQAQAYVRAAGKPPVLEAVVLVLRGWACAELGADGGGTADAESGVLLFCSTGARIAYPWLSCMLSQARARAGRFEDALEAIRDGLQEAASTGDRASESELYRLQGELLAEFRGAAAAADIDASFRRSLDVAQSLRAPAWLLVTLRSYRRWLGDPHPGMDQATAALHRRIASGEAP